MKNTRRADQKQAIRRDQKRRIQWDVRNTSLPNSYLKRLKYFNPKTKQDIKRSLRLSLLYFAFKYDLWLKLNFMTSVLHIQN